mmetsp:Transcript_17763/g.25159  ORF Transcript_17763/g.25159 Transcript_17763/m.25159 type:complete len:229 (-) Transcript_17763:95-781(-)
MNKSFISIFLTALLASSNAEPDTSKRILKRGGGGGGNKLAKLQNMIDTKCTAAFSLTCPDDTLSDDECTFEKPERPDITTGLSQEEIQQLKEDYRAARQERKEQLLVCACCGGYSLDEMLPFAQGSGSGGDGSGSGSGRPGLFGGGGGGSRPDVDGGSGFMGGGGGQSQSGTGRPGRGGGLRNREPNETEVDVEVSGDEESISSIDEGDTSGDESSSADQVGGGGRLR